MGSVDTRPLFEVLSLCIAAQNVYGLRLDTPTYFVYPPPPLLLSSPLPAYSLNARLRPHSTLVHDHQLPCSTTLAWSPICACLPSRYTLVRLLANPLTLHSLKLLIICPIPLPLSPHPPALPAHPEFLHLSSFYLPTPISAALLFNHACNMRR